MDKPITEFFTELQQLCDKYKIHGISGVNCGPAVVHVDHDYAYHFTYDVDEDTWNPDAKPEELYPPEIRWRLVCEWKTMEFEEEV